MRTYTVTESELWILSLANGLMTIFFSLGSGFVGIALDITKDVMLSPELAKTGEALAEIVRPACVILAVVFFACGLWAFMQRQSTIALIKKESGLQARCER